MSEADGTSGGSESPEALAQRIDELRGALARRTRSARETVDDRRSRATGARRLSKQIAGAMERWEALIGSGSPLMDDFDDTEKALDQEQEEAAQEFQQSKLPQLQDELAALRTRLEESSAKVARSAEASLRRLSQRQRALEDLVHRYASNVEDIEEQPDAFLEMSADLAQLAGEQRRSRKGQQRGPSASSRRRGFFGRGSRAAEESADEPGEPPV